MGGVHVTPPPGEWRTAGGVSAWPPPNSIKMPRKRAKTAPSTPNTAPGITLEGVSGSSDPAPASDESLLGQARSVLAEAIGALRSCVREVQAQLFPPDGEKPKYNSGLASHLAYLTQHVAGLLTAFRQLEAHDAKMAKTLPPAEKTRMKALGIVGYLRKLTPEERARVFAEAETLQ